MHSKEFTITATVSFRLKVWADHPHSPDWWQKRAEQDARAWALGLETMPFQPTVSTVQIKPADAA